VVVLEQFESWLANYIPSWLAYLIPIFVAFAILSTFILLIVMAFIYFERRGIGRFQIRPGPNRAGPFGILQPVADTIKILTKEDIIPALGDRWVHLLAPIVVFVPALMIFAVIPFEERAIVADLNVGILYIVAISSLGVIGVFMAGWGSNNKYSLIAAMRSVAQMVSYELPLMLSIAGVLIIAGSLSMRSIVDAQGVPFILLQPLGFLIFFLAAAAEINRTPFDLLEAESEIVAGFHIEYSGMKFALFYLAEYTHAFAICAIVTILFLGGWSGPLLPAALWFMIKVFLVFGVFLWLRSTLPRLRIDQVMAFAWKGLFPLAVINVFVTAGELIAWPEFPWWLLFVNIPIAAILIVLWSGFFRVAGEPVSFDRYGRGIAKGMALTFEHLFRRPITVQYPEQRLTPAPRFRGNMLVWDEEACIACRACARACPVSIIDIETSKGDKGLVVEKLEIDFGRCLFCGLCVEACPKEALFMSRDYEQASYRREQLVVNKEQFVAAEKRPSAYGYPDREAEMPAQTLLAPPKEKE